MLESFAEFFADNIWLAVILISLIPTLEGRIALPFALSVSLLENNTLPPYLALICAFVGSVLPALPVVLATRKIKNRFFTGFVQERYMNKVNKLSTQKSTFKKLALLCGFVAIPLPMTGVWSGSVVAGCTNLKIWQSLVAIAIGSLISCSIILGVCLLFAGSELVILYISVGLLALFAIYELVVRLIKKKSKRDSI